MIDLSKKTPYCYQGDSSNASQSWRMCFSSSCAMLVESIRPGTLYHHPKRKGRQLDDFYRETLESMRVGDTTEYTAQLATLKHFCPLDSFSFTTNATPALLAERLSAGVTVPMGILHHGSLDAPSGGGHWICCVGMEGDGAKGRFICHDPAGELDVRGGGYLSSAPTAGKAVRYSIEGLRRRWELGANGRYTPGNGWAILAKKAAK